MRIRSITVEARETVSLPGYNNIARGVTLVADISEQDDEINSYDVLSMMVDAHLREEIDGALEDNEQPPKYYNGARYGVVISGSQKRIAVVPASRNLPSGWYWEFGSGSGFREETANRLAAKVQKRTGFVIHFESDVRNLPGAATFEPGAEECF